MAENYEASIKMLDYVFCCANSDKRISTRQLHNKECYHMIREGRITIPRVELPFYAVFLIQKGLTGEDVRRDIGIQPGTKLEVRVSHLDN